MQATSGFRASLLTQVFPRECDRFESESRCNARLGSRKTNRPSMPYDLWVLMAPWVQNQTAKKIGFSSNHGDFQAFVTWRSRPAQRDPWSTRVRVERELQWVEWFIVLFLEATGGSTGGNEYVWLFVNVLLELGFPLVHIAVFLYILDI